jgi:hypothetical protein
MESIGPFTKLPEYPFVFCNACEYACIADEVQTHLWKHHKDIDKKERGKIIAVVKSINPRNYSQPDSIKAIHVAGETHRAGADYRQAAARWYTM